jgi:hypothetical protein
MAVMSLQRASLSELFRLFSSLEVPAERLRAGSFRAEFIGPWWLRISSGPSIALAGLPGWRGKRFLSATTATNVLRARDGSFTEALTMSCLPGPSQVDGKPGLALHYGVQAPRPWRWVTDELRALDEDTLLAMTVIGLPVLRHLAFPFLLVRER